MPSVKSPKVRKPIVLLLLLTLALGPIGCGAELIPAIVGTCVAVGIVAVTVHQIQEIESAELDNQLKRLRIRGYENGNFITYDRQLKDDEVRRIVETGEVKINGKKLVLRPE